MENVNRIPQEAALVPPPVLVHLRKLLPGSIDDVEALSCLCTLRVDLRVGPSGVEIAIVLIWLDAHAMAGTWVSHRLLFHDFERGTSCLYQLFTLERLIVAPSYENAKVNLNEAPVSVDRALVQDFPLRRLLRP